MRKRIIACLGFLFVFGISLFASTSTQAMPWESGLQTIANSLGGPTAKIIGVILIIGGGIALAVSEGQAMKKLFWVILGLGVALNAASFLSMVYGSSAGALITSLIH